MQVYGQVWLGQINKIFNLFMSAFRLMTKLFTFTSKGWKIKGKGKLRGERERKSAGGEGRRWAREKREIYLP